MTRVLAMLLVAGLAAGCAPLESEEPPPKEYVLAAASGIEPTLEGLPRPLAVARPAVPPGLDGRRIRLLRPGNRLDHFADARWAAPLPDVLHDVVRGTLAHATGRAETVAAASDTARHELRVRLESFHPVYDRGAEAPPLLRVELVVALVDRRRGATVAAVRSAPEPRRLEANRLPAIVAGLERLFNERLLAAMTRLAERWREHRERDPAGGDGG